MRYCSLNWSTSKLSDFKQPLWLLRCLHAGWRVGVLSSTGLGDTADQRGSRAPSVSSPWTSRLASVFLCRRRRSLQARSQNGHTVTSVHPDGSKQVLQSSPKQGLRKCPLPSVGQGSGVDSHGGEELGSFSWPQMGMNSFWASIGSQTTARCFPFMHLSL